LDLDVRRPVKQTGAFSIMHSFPARKLTEIFRIHNFFHRQEFTR